MSEIINIIIVFKFISLFITSISCINSECSCKENTISNKIDKNSELKSIPIKTLNKNKGEEVVDNGKEDKKNANLQIVENKVKNKNGKQKESKKLEENLKNAKNKEKNLDINKKKEQNIINDAGEKPIKENTKFEDPWIIQRKTYEQLQAEAEENFKKKEEEERRQKEEAKSNDIKRRQKIINELIKNQEIKYKKTDKTNVDSSKYADKLQNVPFLCDYYGVGYVRIPFAFELKKGYIDIFPKEMVKKVNTYLRDNEVDDENFHIFFCYQYLFTKCFPDDQNKIFKKILFRPHYFIAKKEIDEFDNSLNKLEYKDRYERIKNRNIIYPANNNKISNICVIFNNENEITDKIVYDFLIHNGCLSTVQPSIGKNTNDIENKEIVVLYSFVLETEKKIAAITIHFLRCPNNFPEFPENISTISDAIEFANKQGDNEVVDFLNDITE